jgi:hypothetical protein
MAANVVVAISTRVGTATDVGVTLDFTRWFGAVTIQNLDPDNDVWIKFDVDGTAVVAADTDGQIRLLAGGGFISIPLAQFTKIGAICAAGLTAKIQAVATESAQAGRR